MKTIQFITASLLMLVAGVFWGTWFALTRSLPDFPADEFIHIGKVIIANVAGPMRIIFPACVIFVLISLFLSRKRGAAFYWIALSTVCIIATLLITLLVEVPIDNQIKTWTAATVPADWTDIRARWDTFHSFRTGTSLAAFGSYLSGMLAWNKLPEKW